MPAGYAHITLVNELKVPRRLEGITGFPQEAILAVLKYSKFCELGAVSPDYPYLALGDEGAKRWADIMHGVAPHHNRTGEIIHAGVRQLQNVKGNAKKKGLAWLLGYAAHVATDVSIHPVVEMKVGPYESNKTDHRVCELHQDAYIFQRLNLGGLGLSEYLDSGIAACRDVTDPELLDRDIVLLWKGMLQDVHPEEFLVNPPDIDKWHGGFNFAIDKIAEEGDKLFPIARHLCVDVGLTYPGEGEIDPQFIRGLATPSGKQDYDKIFEAAIHNIGEIWQVVARGATQGDKSYLDHVYRVSIFLIILLVPGSCLLRPETKSETMYTLGAALRKVSDSVEATVRYENPPVGIGDAELLAMATKHDPGLLVPFAEYKVRVMREEGHAILLVCDKEGRVGLLEDAGCSSPLDKHLWNEDPPKSCDFTINIATVCHEPVPR